jgi:hypothetical protein
MYGNISRVLLRNLDCYKNCALKGAAIWRNFVSKAETTINNIDNKLDATITVYY